MLLCIEDETGCRRCVELSREQVIELRDDLHNAQAVDGVIYHTAVALPEGLKASVDEALG